MPTPSPQTDTPDLDLFAADFAEFHARFTDLFVRSEPREQMAKYLRGLLGGVERRNGWQMAEAAGDAAPDKMQRLLRRVEWSAVRARDRLQRFIIERFGDHAGIGILDETGFLKKGNESVGVQRQYTGTAGKIENCQIGVFLGYSSRAGHALLDRALYLPECWSSDAARRAKARVPSRVQFHTKPELAARMLRRSWRNGVPMAWVTGDEVYGNDPALRDAIDRAGKRYVMAVASSTPAWSERPVLQQPDPAVGMYGGRPRSRVRLAAGQPRASTVSQIASQWTAQRWKRLVVSQGEKGPIEYDWAAARIVESRNHLPSADLWLLVRRSVSDPTECAYYLSNAPAKTPLTTLVEVASSRWRIEQCFEEAKDDVGLDQYEVRSWPAWHRHITLAMMAQAWLASVRLGLDCQDPNREASGQEVATSKKGESGALRRGPSPKSAAS
jgi:SRSO17 transposase